MGRPVGAAGLRPRGADHLGDHEAEELLGELGVHSASFGQRPEAGDLLGLAYGVRRRQPVRGLELTDLLGDLEPLGQQVNQGRVHVVDAGP